jgi:light-regulated signal transduction histidine kinase (bacteriophytochrome)
VRKLLAFCHHLRRSIGTNLSSRAEQDIHYIIDAATRMQVLIHTLLAFSKSEQTAVKYEWLSVDDCVDEVLDVLALRLKETRATIHRDPLPAILGDRCLLTLIYQNLIENALKFVTKQAPIVRLTAEQTDDGWVLGVQDQGIGIKPEQAESIFAPFVRLHSDGAYPGAGIGLAICRKAVERHQGRIWVDASPGQGAYFKFILGTTVEKKEVSPSSQSSHAVG